MPSPPCQGEGPRHGAVGTLWESRLVSLNTAEGGWLQRAEEPRAREHLPRMTAPPSSGRQHLSF